MTRARDIGVPFNGDPGPLNAITDIPGVEVGHETIISGEAGPDAIRTGVTAILPLGKKYEPVFAGWYSFNGCGELTGTTWVEESGFLESAIMLTDTMGIGAVRNGMIKWAGANIMVPQVQFRDVFWGLPVVGETNNMDLSNMISFPVGEEHAIAALDNAKSGTVKEGNVGGGTGMVCHEFKGGIGTASRLVEIEGKTYTVGALVQSNHGGRWNFHIAGVPVGEEIPDLLPELNGSEREPGSGSIIVVIATDCPLLPHQLKRLARRVPLGIGVLGGSGSNGSGDISIAFSTANTGAARLTGLSEATFLPNALMTDLFYATIQSTEEAIINSLVAAETMVGFNGNKAYALPHDRVIAALKKYNRFRK